MEELINAIIIRACSDYVDARRCLERNIDRDKNEKIVDECLDFFYSSEFEVMCDIDRELLIDELERRVKTNEQLRGVYNKSEGSQ